MFGKYDHITPIRYSNKLIQVVKWDEDVDCPYSRANKLFILDLCNMYNDNTL